MSLPRGSTTRPIDWPGLSIAIGACVIIGLSVVLPLTGAVLRAIFGAVAAKASPLPGLATGSSLPLANGVGWAVGIGLVGTAFGAAAAWTLWRRGPVVAALLLTPLLVPSTLAYAGWGLLRAPHTWLGARLELAAQSGWHELPVVVGKLLAALGLALWAFPIGAVVVWNALRGIPDDVVQSMRSEGARGLTVVKELSRACSPSLALSVLVIALVMLGSAVPLHLAQVETLSVQVWFALDNLPIGERWRAWATAWPLLGIAVAAGWWLGGQAADYDPGEINSASARAGWASVIPGAVPWVLGVAVPFGFFVAHCGDLSGLARFWEGNGPAVSRSLGVACGVGACTLVISLGTAWGLARGGHAAGGARAGVRLLVISGLVPGVLIGSAMGGVVTWLADARLDDSIVPVIGAHVARFGFLGAMAGCLGANAAHRLVGDVARLDGADHGIAWVRASVAPVLGVHGAAAAGAAVLSLHEIEATVQVMPPGDCLARVILGDLHYARVADMSAAGLWMIAAGLIPGLAAGAWLLHRGSRRA